MARALRVEYEGATYHVMGRGNRGNPVFQCQEDVDLWLETLEEACERSKLRVHAYCLMSTHYHLLLETPRGNLVEGMKWLQGTFTQRYNAFHKQWGHLFQGRYKAKVVDASPGYFSTVGLYILLNPVAAGLIDLQKDSNELLGYTWSSYPLQVGRVSGRPDWLQVERLFKSLGIPADSTSGRRAFAAKLRERGILLQRKKCSEEDQEKWEEMERGWVHGSTAFRKEMVKLLEKEAGKAVFKGLAGEQSRDIGTEQALRSLQDGMEVLGLRWKKLKHMRKGDERKLLLGGWIRRHYPVSAKWCASILEMGHPSSLTRAWHFYENPPNSWKKEKRKLEKILKL